MALSYRHKVWSFSSNSLPSMLGIIWMGRAFHFSHVSPLIRIESIRMGMATNSKAVKYVVARRLGRGAIAPQCMIKPYIVRFVNTDNWMVNEVGKSNAGNIKLMKSDWAIYDTLDKAKEHYKRLIKHDVSRLESRIDEYFDVLTDLGFDCE